MCVCVKMYSVECVSYTKYTHLTYIIIVQYLHVFYKEVFKRGCQQVFITLAIIIIIIDKMCKYVEIHIVLS